MNYQEFEFLVLVFSHIGFLVLGILIGRNLLRKENK